MWKRVPAPQSTGLGWVGSEPGATRTLTAPTSADGAGHGAGTTFGPPGQCAPTLIRPRRRDVRGERARSGPCGGLSQQAGEHSGSIRNARCNLRELCRETATDDKRA